VFLAAHHGVFTRAEALSLGVSRGQLHRLVATGVLERVQPSTYRLTAAPASWNGRVRAAAVSCGGAASHRAAAAIWEIDGFENAPVEITHWNTQRLDRDGARVHFSTQMHLADITVRDGVPVTGPSRTVLDLFAVLSPKRRIQALDASLRTSLVDLASLEEVIARHSIQGRTGVGRLRVVLEEGYGSRAIPDSRWNRMVRQLFDDHGLPPSFFEHEVFDEQGLFVARVDLAFAEHRVAIELDSVKWHLNRESFTRDPRRRNRLNLAGWQVLSFTWDDYAKTPDRLVATVRQALRQSI